MKRFSMKPVGVCLALGLGVGVSLLRADESIPPVPPSLTKLNDLVQALNLIPEDQITEKSGPGYTLLEQVRQEDGPDYVKLKQLIARADIRKALNPSTKGTLATLVSPRWEGFNLAGNLWLAALKSSNADIRAKARRQLVYYIQPPHIPVLINILKEPGPNILAFDVLRDVTGQSLDPTVQAWTAWWRQSQDQVDLVGYLVEQTRTKIPSLQVRGFDQSAFWHAPEGIERVGISYAQRSIDEKNILGRWSDWVRADVGHYLEQWDEAKPLFDQIVHQPDPKVGTYLKSILSDPGFGDYAAVVLVWRGDMTALPALQEAYKKNPTVGRALGRGSMGDKTALEDLLKMIDAQPAPLSFGIMDEQIRGFAAKMPAYGIVPAEQAFELLTHQRFGLSDARTAGDKRRAYKKARQWLIQNGAQLSLDKKRGYYTVSLAAPSSPPSKSTTTTSIP